MNTIYAVPTEFEKSVPNIFQNYEKYQELEEAWIAKLKKFCLENNDGKYIGEILKFPVADGQALYMIAQLTPKVELLHLPLMDAYNYPHVQYLPVHELTKQIDGTKRFEAFLKTQCNVGEVNSFLEEFGDEVYDMPDHALELIMDDHVCVKWNNPLDNENGEVEYFVKKDNSFYGKQEEKVLSYLRKNFGV